MRKRQHQKSPHLSAHWPAPGRASRSSLLKSCGPVRDQSLPASLLNQLATRYCLLPYLFSSSFTIAHNSHTSPTHPHAHTLCVPSSSHPIIASHPTPSRLPSRRTLKVRQGACWRVPGQATNPGNAPVWARSERRSPVNVEPHLLPHPPSFLLLHQQRYRAAFARRLSPGTATGRIPRVHRHSACTSSALPRHRHYRRAPAGRSLCRNSSHCVPQPTTTLVYQHHTPLHHCPGTPIAERIC